MPRLSNAKLVELAKAYKAAKADEAAAKATANQLRDQLLDQLKIRQTTELDLGGVVVQRKAKRLRSYSIDRLRQVLPRKLFAEVAPPTVKLSVLDDAVKAGQVDQVAVDGCLVSDTESAPYVDVRLTA